MNNIDPYLYNNESQTIDDITRATGLQKPMDFDVRTKSFEEKTFIILYKIDDDDLDDIYKSCYSLCIGRTETYNDIKNKLISGVPIDIHRSKIITETKQTESISGDRKYYLLPYEECISVYSFCTSVKSNYQDDDFDIENYNTSEIPEDYNELAESPNYLTPEQIEYRNMLEAAIGREKLFRDLAKSRDNDGSNI